MRRLLQIATVHRLKHKYGRKKRIPREKLDETGSKYLLNKIDDTGDTKRKQGSGRPRTSLILGQDSDPGTHLNLREREYHKHLLIRLQNLILDCKI